MKYSIITPVHLWSDNRVEMFKKCIESVKNQTEQDFEWVIVDDGSTKDFDWNYVTSQVPQAVIYHKNHQERVIAYNLAFKHAKGNWFTLLDADDEYVPTYLEEVSSMIKEYQNIRCLILGVNIIILTELLLKENHLDLRKLKSGMPCLEEEILLMVLLFFIN